jgi:hypothetical protein
MRTGPPLESHPTSAASQDSSSKISGRRSPTAELSGSPAATPDGATRDAIAEARRRILGEVEGFIKLAAGGLGAVAAIGFPAVYFHFSAFGVPTHFITYDQGLRAGTLPTVLLVLVGAYVYWTWRHPIFPLLPAIAVMVPLFILGYVSTIVVFMWLLTWPFAWAITKVIGVPWTTRGVLVTALCAVAIIVPPMLIFGFREARRAARSVLPPPGLARREAANAMRFPPDVGSALEFIERLPRQWMRTFVMFLFATASCALFVFSARLVIHLWDPELTSRYLATRYLWVFCAALSIGSGSLMVFEWFTRPSGRRAITLLAGIGGIAAYISVLGVYSYALYGRIPHGMGGGRPTPTVLWVKDDDLPDGAAQAMPAGSVLRQDEWVRLSKVYLLHASSDVVIVTNKDVPPGSGFALPRDKVQAFSW